MIVALIDNGSLAPAAHANLRSLAAELTVRSGVRVHPVSWKHSDRIDPAQLGGFPAQTLAAWLRAQFKAGERDFVFLPFFISEQGAIGSWLRKDIERLSAELGGFHFAFSSGLNREGALVTIVASRIRELIASQSLHRPAVVVVDHGGPSESSARLRNRVADELRALLGPEIGALKAASLEGEEYSHSLPLFEHVLASPELVSAPDVVIAPLFLAPGRHAGPDGDLASIARDAEARATTPPLHCHFTELVGTHPLVVDVLGRALAQTLSSIHVAA